jgi:hypothetical protein
MAARIDAPHALVRGLAKQLKGYVAVRLDAIASAAAGKLDMLIEEVMFGQVLDESQSNE